MTKKIFISARLDQTALERIAEFGKVDHYDWGKEGKLLSPEDLENRANGCEILIIESDVLSNKFIDSNPNLKLIVVCKGGVVNVDIAYANSKGVQVAHTPGRNADAVADLTICFMIMLTRHLLPAIKTFSTGDWNKIGKRETYLAFQGYELVGKNIGLVGLGAIGFRVANRLKAFNAQVQAYDPFVSQEQALKYGVNLVSLEALFSHADIISIHAPNLPSTRGMITKELLKRMKPSAYFINTARAELVDEKALLESLQNRNIAGAAVDVFLEEPLPVDSLWYDLPNVVCTPHIGGASKDVIYHQSQMVIQIIEEYCQGKPLSFIAKPL